MLLDSFAGASVTKYYYHTRGTMLLHGCQCYYYISLFPRKNCGHFYYTKASLPWKNLCFSRNFLQQRKYFFFVNLSIVPTYIILHFTSFLLACLLNQRRKERKDLLPSFFLRYLLRFREETACLLVKNIRHRVKTFR